MSNISASLRTVVTHRALFRCEYCRIPDLGFGLGIFALSFSATPDTSPSQTSSH